MRILIVDDSPFARMMIQRHVMIAMGPETTIDLAEHGEQALEKMYSFSPELVIVDLNMPVMDGRAYIKQTRQRRRFKDIPIIVVSSLINSAATTELLALGATSVLGKPLSPSSLATALKEISPGVAT